MTITSKSVAGTMESSDIMITLSPADKPGIDIDLKSTVLKQFGKKIRAVIEETLLAMGVQSVQVVAVDKGALDCAVRARVRAAVCRAAGRGKFDWQGVQQ